MKTNFIETVWSYFDENLIQQAAGYLGESESTIQKLLNSIIPVALGGMIHKAESGNVQTISVMAKDAFKTDILKHRSNTFTRPGGGIPSYAPTMLTNLFGDKFGSIENKVAAYAGSKGTSSASLFGTVVPVALAALGKYAAENNLSPSALAAELVAGKTDVLSAIPVELGLAGLFETPLATEASVSKEKKNNWGLLLLGLLVVVALFWWLFGQKKDATPVATTEQVIVRDTILIEKNPVKLKLPNGTIINAYKGGIEDLLIAFIEDPNAKPGNDNWFDFNELNFKMGTAEMLPESGVQLSNIIEILKAYPKVKVKIGGYTDKVGGEEINKKLSFDRANAVATAIKDAGLAGQLAGAEGYGSDFAKYPDSAPEVDRVKDRRVSVNVRAK